MTQRQVNVAVIVGATMVALGIGAAFWPAGLAVAGLELILGVLFLVDDVR